MAAATKTRTRSTSAKKASSSRATATKTATKSAAKKAGAAKKGGTKRAAQTAEAQEAAAKRREEAAAKLVAERDAAIKAGTLVVEGDTEFHKSEKEEDGVVLTKAKDIIEALKATDNPVSKRDIAEPNIMSVGIFAALKAMGVVEEFRARGGKRGVAYRWIGDR
jgi:RNA polymerase primary sigma factor